VIRRLILTLTASLAFSVSPGGQSAIPRTPDGRPDDVRIVDHFRFDHHVVGVWTIWMKLLSRSTGARICLVSFANGTDSRGR
jgi:hypothetical protein